MKKSAILLTILILGVIQIAFSQQKMKGYQEVIVANNKENDKIAQPNNGLFQGTKIFADKGQFWKSVVTIYKNSFTVKSYPGKNNNYYQNKNIAQSTEIGYIENGKIYTKSADNRYLPDLYKYESGKFYQLNNENEYNDYVEINSSNTDSLSNEFGKSGSGLAEMQIALSRFTNLVTPQDDGTRTGRIAVRIKFNKSGIVTEAIPGIRGTTLSDSELWQKCKNAIMGASLTPSEFDPDVQMGVVVFNFEAK